MLIVINDPTGQISISCANLLQQELAEAIQTAIENGTPIRELINRIERSA